METMQDAAARKQIVFDHIQAQIDNIGNDKVENLRAELVVLLREFCEKNKLPPVIGGQEQLEGICRVFLNSPSHIEALKMWIGEEVIKQMYGNITKPKRATKAKSA